MSFIIDYLSVIVTVLTALLVYKKFKSGWFVKKETNEEVQDDEQKQSRFKRWWMKSYIREIYVVRASQRKSACFVPWAGVVISALFVYWFVSALYDGLAHPSIPFEKLTKHDGVVKGYVYRQKSAGILIVQLPSGEKKYFHMSLRKKEVMETWMDKNATVWVHQDWGVIDGNYEWVNVVDLNGSTVLGSKTFDRNAYNKKYVEDTISSLLRSLAWLFGFLALLWIINRNPVVAPTITNNKH